MFEEDGDLQIAWKDGELLFTFISIDDDGDPTEEEYTVSKESAYELCLFLIRKFKVNLKKNLK